MKIILIGGPASGKTKVGKTLAKSLGLPFFDTDHCIETQSNKKVTDIFKEEGESIFRKLETQTLQNLLALEDAVISTGGGIVKKEENRVLLQKEAAVIFLNVSVHTQMKRTQNDSSRPLLMGQDKRAILEKLHAERDPLYRSIAKLTVNAEQALQTKVDQIIEFCHNPQKLKPQ